MGAACLGIAVRRRTAKRYLHRVKQKRGERSGGGMFGRLLDRTRARQKRRPSKSGRRTECIARFYNKPCGEFAQIRKSHSGPFNLVRDYVSAFWTWLNLLLAFVPTA
jgi:hypothetical protein